MADTKTKRPKVVVTVAKFDSHSGARLDYANVRDAVKVGAFDVLTALDYAPRGMTPLRDATAMFIKSLEREQADDRVVVGLLLDESGSMRANQQAVIQSANEFVRSMSDVKKVDRDAAGKVLAVILTDGLENASVETTPQALSSLIAGKEQSGWTFIYMGANQDAWAVADSTGFSGGATGQSVAFQATPAGTRSAMGYAGAAGVGYLSDNSAYMAAAAAAPQASVGEDGSVAAKDQPQDPAPDTADALAAAMRVVSES